MTDKMMGQRAEEYRKKPVVIQAIQYLPTTCEAICRWMGIEHNVYPGEPCGVGQFAIQTLEGEMLANPGDWIIRGIKGEFYPCKPDIFEATYEPAASAEREGGREWRETAWARHGCPITALYGDDGEMQCNSGMHKPMDFKRRPVVDIVDFLAEREAGRGEKRMDENRIARMCDDFEAQRIKDGLTPFAAEQETDGYERGLCHAKDFYESHPTPDAEKGRTE